MEIPLTICTATTIQYSDGAVPAYVDEQEVFIFFGVPTAADYEMVDQYIYETAEHHGAADGDVMAELNSGDSYGMNKFIELPEGNLTTNWEQRL